MSRFFSVVNVLGKMILIFGLVMLVPWGFAEWTEDGAQLVFERSFAITMLSGFLLWLGTRHYRRELQTRDGFLLVVLVWFLARETVKTVQC